MSSNTIPSKGNQISASYENIGPYGNATGSFANLDTAFDQSVPMCQFQNRLAHNPMIAQKLADYDNDQILISPQSEEKINSNVEKIVAYYDRNRDIANQISPQTAKQYINPEIPIVQNGVSFPLNRSQHYPPQYGSELLEGYDLQEDTQYVLDSTNTVSGPTAGTSFVKFILLILLIAILIYGAYWIYKNGISGNVNAPVATNFTSPSSTVSLEKFFG